MKNARHSKILELIGQHSIDKQEELLAHLRRSGFEVTQATVSRDIRELGLVKVATGDGHYRYVAASGAGKSAHSPSRFETIFRESVLKADFAGHFVLVKCYTGMANAACEVFVERCGRHAFRRRHIPCPDALRGCRAHSRG